MSVYFNIYGRNIYFTDAAFSSREVRAICRQIENFRRFFFCFVFWLEQTTAIETRLNVERLGGKPCSSWIKVIMRVTREWPFREARGKKPGNNPIVTQPYSSNQSWVQITKKKKKIIHLGRKPSKAYVGCVVIYTHCTEILFIKHFSTNWRLEFSAESQWILRWTLFVTE